MSDYIVEHALKNAWCSPFQDYQGRFKPARLTPLKGTNHYVNVLNQRLKLPTVANEDYYHVFQMGQVPPSMYNLFKGQRIWYPLTQVVRENKVLIDLYTDHGYLFPRFESYMLLTPDKNLIFAVKDQKKMPVSLADTDLYVHFYSNAFFASERSVSTSRMVYVYGLHIKNSIDIVNVQTLFADYKNLPGEVYGVVNGLVNNVLNAITVKIGDVVEFVYDSSVKQTIDFTIGNLDTFTSTLDLVEKYILHSPLIPHDTIEYWDDLEFFVMRPISAGVDKGVLYNRNRVDAVRMITHKDYSIPSAVIDAHAAAVPFLNPIGNMKLRVQIRHSGYRRPLIDEANRIKELYKLSEPEFRGAIMGIDSTIPEWKAENLEHSDYTRIMRTYGHAIDKPMVTSAYGYNAIANLVAPSPLSVKLDGGIKVVELPAGCRQGATIYEYNATGLLLGFYTQVSGELYVVKNQTAEFVEVLVGIGSNTMGLEYGKATTTKISGVGYRLYRASKIDGVVAGEWEDVTGSSYYTETANQFTWNLNANIWMTLVKSDNRFLAYSFNMSPADNLLKFSLSSQETIGSTTTTRTLHIPNLRLDIWLNGRALIENIDYVVQWPNVIINNKLYRKASGPQTITIRDYGLPKAGIKREVSNEGGYVSYGVLSRNNRFDIRDDKVMRFVANGYVKRRQDIRLQEDTQVLLVNHSLNGKPYQISDQVVPIMNFASEDTYTLREAALELDGRISDYLTLKLPEPEANTPNAIAERYPLISPFFSKVLADVLSGVIEPSFIESVYSTQSLTARLEPYMELLAFDPTQPTQLFDQDNAIVHPYAQAAPVHLTLFQWQFMKKINSAFLYDRVETTEYFTVQVL